MKSFMKRAMFALAGVAFVTACGDTEEEKVVNVYNWSDYIDEEILKEFTAETGIKVVYDVFDSNDVLETKLLAGKTGYDVVVPSGGFLARQMIVGDAFSVVPFRRHDVVKKRTDRVRSCLFRHLLMLHRGRVTPPEHDIE